MLCCPKIGEEEAQVGGKMLLLSPNLFLSSRRMPCWAVRKESVVWRSCGWAALCLGLGSLLGCNARWKRALLKMLFDLIYSWGLVLMFVHLVSTWGSWCRGQAHSHWPSSSLTPWTTFSAWRVGSKHHSTSISPSLHFHSLCSYGDRASICVVSLLTQPTSVPSIHLSVPPSI